MTILSSLSMLSCTVASESTSDCNAINLHPLCIEEILAVLFKYFSFTDLKLFRTVCKTWEKEARHVLTTETKRWKIAPITLNNDWTISKFLSLVNNHQLFFDFPKFHLVGIVYEPKKTSTKTSKFLRLLSICGHRITSLNLKYVGIRGKFSAFVTFFNELQQLCPNLKKLGLKSVFAVKENLSDLSQSQLIHWGNVNLFEKLTSLTICAPVFSDNGHFDQRGFDVYMKHLFKIAPNLEEFNYFDRTERSINYLDAVTNSIIEGNLSKLNTLHLNTSRGDVHNVKQLETLKPLKLRSVKFGVDDADALRGSLLEFWQSQLNLSSLQICFNLYDIPQWNLELPETFGNLHELNIPYGIFSFGILKSTPALRKLTLRGNPKSTCWIEESSDNPEISLTNVEQCSLANCLKKWSVECKCCPASFNIAQLKCEFIVDEPTIQFFSKRFTNLEALQIGYLSEDVLIHVYEKFKDLKDFGIVCPPAMYVSSRAYLGESKNIALTESRKAGFKLEIESRNKVAEYIRSSEDPSILSLKDLQRLELRRFGSIVSMNRIHHSIECSSGFMFGISALQNVTELKLHPFIHRRAVMSLQLMPSLKKIWAVPLIIGSRETGGRSDFPTTAYWYQVLLRKRPDLKIYVTTAPTQREQENGIFGSATRVLQIQDVYRGNATASGLFVYLDEYYMYQDGCEVLKDGAGYMQKKSSSQCSIC